MLKQPAISIFLHGLWDSCTIKGNNCYPSNYAARRQRDSLMLMVSWQARLRMVDVVEKEDINEALCLMEMSKQSLYEPDLSMLPPSATTKP